jgi:hypothetical protein
MDSGVVGQVAGKPGGLALVGHGVFEVRFGHGVGTSLNGPVTRLVGS